MLLSSTVERMLKEMPCSVLVVPPPTSAAETVPGNNRGETRPVFPAA
jgi:hypothetical protein